VVAGANLNISIVFSRAPEYPVTFTATGLHPGAQWYVQLNGSGSGLGGFSQNQTISLELANGTYSVTATAAGYILNASLPDVTVAGAAVNVTVPFWYAPYAVWFAPNGLPSGDSYTVALDSRTSTGGGYLYFLVPNGSYQFTVVPPPTELVTPSNGTVSVAGQNVTVDVNFTTNYSLPIYAVTFDEVGLPSGDSWSVAVGNLTGSSSNETLSFALPDGAYAFVVTAPSGYVASPGGGGFTINGSFVTENISFSPGSVGPFWVGFVETGLPAGSIWSVGLGTMNETSSNPTITFDLPDGTYFFVVRTEVDLHPVPASGTVQVNGGSVRVNISFEGGPPMETVGGGSAPSVLPYIAGTAIAAAGVVGGTLIVARLRRADVPKSWQPSAEESTSSTTETIDRLRPPGNP
jgi:hypothetical protein